VLTDQVFPWVKESQAKVEAWEKANPRKAPKSTANQFFNMMRLLAPVVIQDVAIWKLKHPERCEKSPLMADPLWRTEEFKVAMPSWVFFFNLLHSPILLCFPGVFGRHGEGLAGWRGKQPNESYSGQRSPRGLHTVHKLTSRNQTNAGWATGARGGIDGTFCFAILIATTCH
jgi:hypothetical protein